jgi:predicted HicB family RNase H-like nuclease
MAQRLVEIIVTHMPDELNEALLADAQAKGVSRNEAATAILAAKYGVAREPSLAPFKQPPARLAAQPMQFTVPERLRHKLNVAAARRTATLTGLVLEALAEEYGVPFDSPRRRRSPRVSA